MQRFDRYLLVQLMVLFGFFALVLVSVYWVNRAVILFDQLIADGHSASVFLEFTALSLPNVIRLVLPMAAFAGTVYVTNRLSNDSELTVMQATGFSPWRLARPVLVFGLIVAGMMTILTHFLVPQSLQQLREREIEISGSVSARLLREGAFLHPARGVTFYIRDITPDGELRDVFLSDRRLAGRSVIYTADRAFLMRDDDGPKLVMLSGQAQTLQTDNQRLSTTTFADLTYDVSGLIEPATAKRPRLSHMSTLKLAADPQAAADEARRDLGQALEELHGRVAQALLCVVAALVGFSALLQGGFSRFGVGKQIVGAIFLLVIIKLIEGAVSDPVRANARLWPLIYLPSATGFAMAGVMLHLAARPFRPRRRAAGGTA
ncbi:LPS export ABC transporter permease LptF [Aestuariicoccus sp. MJ-SS9]|uniref:LPS export ABC transporter permease LptF n=1 Tax=Aestuariicoccus sp. MJ-SS9 TaxID=3079855 RepID=UPI00290D72A2|nr:LPS export ABC transporter permease LptF [Aestuariicoccus sp. MJ-SS9]MDU8910505.1 LPS export ABC transporter permease LptF [Aestuariicoccus sp. MJ-SS9]